MTEQGGTVALVVERDEQVRALLRSVLEAEGVAVAFASDGEEALQVARSRRPGLVITEILLPRLDGLALCRRIRSDPELRDAALLVLSVLSASARAREAGADAFLLKPLSERSLRDTIARLLHGEAEQP